MSLGKRILGSRVVLGAIGVLGAGFLRLVERTSRFAVHHEPGAAFDEIDFPAIVAMWHGQHFMVHMARPQGQRFVGLMSRSRDGSIGAAVMGRLGVEAIRGSGARGRNSVDRGGAAALRAMLGALREGTSVVLTADVPKVAKVCGAGTVTLARLSGRPVVPVAVVKKRRIDFRSWDRASIGLPFGRGAIVYGTPIRVPADAGPDEIERARRNIGASLDRVHARAYGLLGEAAPVHPEPDGSGLTRSGRG